MSHSYFESLFDHGSGGCQQIYNGLVDDAGNIFLIWYYEGIFPNLFDRNLKLLNYFLVFQSSSMSVIRFTVLILFTYVSLLFSCCQKDKIDDPVSDEDSAELEEVDEVIYDETGCLFTSYNKLVMAGYQGWFAAEGDASERGWHHYKNNKCGGFYPGCSSIDMWPDMSEYATKYVSPFKHQDGSIVYLYSPYDETSVDLHFKWMKDYGIDGVHMQRFISEVKPTNEKGRRHFDKVLKNALKAAKKYGRAISIMYDLSGSDSERVAYLEEDWNSLINQFELFNNVAHPTFLRHNGKPMLSIWGVGFKDREYSIEDVEKLVSRLKGPENKVAIMLGVPYYWRTLERDTENSPALHELIKKVDIIMPWAVGRYHMDSYSNNNVIEDIKWTKQNGVDYVPLVFPGFTWGNLKQDISLYDQIPRLKGDFLWKQIAGAKLGGAESLYVAMFDEVDEGTAIFKVSRQHEVPLNGNEGMKFVGIEDELETDHYLWLAGQGAMWFHGEGSYGSVRPLR